MTETRFPAVRLDPKQFLFLHSQETPSLSFTAIPPPNAPLHREPPYAQRVGTLCPWLCPHVFSSVYKDSFKQVFSCTLIHVPFESFTHSLSISKLVVVKTLCNAFVHDELHLGHSFFTQFDIYTSSLPTVQSRHFLFFSSLLYTCH